MIVNASLLASLHTRRFQASELPPVTRLSSRELDLIETRTFSQDQLQQWFASGETGTATAQTALRKQE